MAKWNSTSLVSTLRSSVPCGHKVGKCVEFMCGSGAWSEAMANEGWSATKFDIAISPDHDILQPGFVEKWCGRLERGEFKAAHLGTCCTTFSRAAHPPYRTAEEILGLKHDSSEKAAKTALGNSLASASAQLFAAAVRGGAVVTIENPWSSLLWLHPHVKPLLKKYFSV